MRCDLHIHSTASDGTLTPEEIVMLAKEKKLIVALTDHNTVVGVPSFLAAAKKYGVTAVPGIEVTTDHNATELHLLGLFVSPDRLGGLHDMMRDAACRKEQSNRDMVSRLNAAGYAIGYDEIKAANPDKYINRVPVARALTEKGYVGSVDEAFKTVLSEKAGFYVPTGGLVLTEVIAALRKSGALPILAHPLQELTVQALYDMLPELIEAGLVGMETYHSSYTDEMIETALCIAEEFHLLASGGSDFHGDNKPTIRLGEGKGNLFIDASVYETLAAAHRQMGD